MRKVFLFVILLSSIFITNIAFCGDIFETNKNVMVEDQINLSINAYVFGFLGGNYNLLFQTNLINMKKDGDLVWFRNLLRPLSTWSWSHARINKIEKKVDGYEVTVEKPDINDLLLKNTPIAAAEWAAFESLTNQQIENLKREVVVRNIRLNVLGNLDLTKEGNQQLREALLKEGLESLSWAKNHKKGIRFLQKNSASIHAATIYILPEQFVSKMDSVIK